MRPAPRLAVLAGLLGLVAAGCGWENSIDDRAATAGLPSTRADIEARDWVLDPDASSLHLTTDDTTITLHVEGDHVSGQAPCNVYGGTFELSSDGSVEIRDVLSTQMACVDRVQRSEDEFLAALQSVDHVKVDVDEQGRDDRDRLILKGPDDLRLAFTSYDAGDLLVGKWDVTGVNTGNAIETPVAGTEPALTFDEDGTLSVTTGCNNGTGDWELDGHDITIGTIAHTLQECATPRGVMDQENALYAALDTVVEVQIAPHRLTLVDEDGRTQVDAVR
jgi:heat shock protein HslJ